MKYRTPTILATGELPGSSGTKIIDVNIQDIISRIMIYWQVTMAGEGMNGYQHLDITKIELVDGSDVLFSMNGGQAQALNIYDRKVPSMNYKQKLGSNSLGSNYCIDFGRFNHDPLLALDPSRFRNLQLKISWNEALADTGASENEMQIMAEVFDEAVPGPIGFLMSKEHFSAVSPSAGYAYVQLPTDHPIRKLLLQGYYLAKEPWYSVSSLRLDEDNEKRIPLDWDIQRYYRMMQAEWTPVVDEFFCYTQGAGGGEYVYVTATDYYVTQSFTDFAGAYQAVGGDSGQGGRLNPTSSTTMMIQGSARGYMPNHCIEFPFGDPKDLDDWYDVTKLGSLRARLGYGSGGATGTQAIVLQQLRRY